MKICSIYKSPKRDEMYLYVEKAKGLNDVPDELYNLFGKPVLVMHMPIKAGSKLSRVDIDAVLASIAEKGFFLQMPPPKEDYLLDLYDPNQAD